MTSDQIVVAAIAGAEAGRRLHELEAAIIEVAKTTTSSFRDVISDVVNLYGSGMTTEEVVAHLRKATP